MEPKKIALESLSKEELLQRYKNLLTIAQRAKAAKDGEFDNQIRFKCALLLFSKLFRRDIY
jgi:hypothetical protein